MGLPIKYIAVLMYLLIALGGIVVDIIVPSLPSIKLAFATSEELTQWAFTAAVVGFGVGQIFAGFVVDSFGRKKPMVIGAILLALLLFVSISSPNIYVLIGIRLLQGLAVSFIAVGGRAVIKDLYQGAEYLKAMNWITISFALGITLSPFVGGYLESHLGWQSVFIALGLWVSGGAILMVLLFEETHPNGHPFKLSSIQTNLSEILGNATFNKIALICGIFYSILPAFNTVGPFLIQEKLGYSPIEYGNIALFLGGCWLAGNFFNRLIINLPLTIKTQISITASIIAIAIGLLYQWKVGLSLWAFILPIAVVIFSLGLLFANYLGIALAPFAHIAGIANALVFSGCWLATAAISFIASTLSSQSTIPLLLLYSALLLTVLGVKRFIKLP